MEKLNSFVKEQNHSENNFSNYFKHELASSKQKFKKEILEIKNELEKVGVAFINEFPIVKFKNKLIKKYAFLFFIHLVGKPISHNENEIKYLWEITPRKSKGKRIGTYSENSETAELHTDSSYKKQPEKFIAIYVNRKANDGGGESTYLDIRKVLKKMENSKIGLSCLTILKNQMFPSIVPTVYHKMNPVIFAPILNKNPFLRFRYDTTMYGFERKVKSKSEEKIAALNYFKTQIDKSNFAKHISLENGTVMLLNNHFMLHGRTKFFDKSRMLYRIRFN